MTPPAKPSPKTAAKDGARAASPPAKPSRKTADSEDDRTAARAVPPERTTFARNLRRVRKKAGLSQRELSARTGLVQSYISEVERCRRNPSLDNMARLANAVGCPLHILMTP